MSSTPDVSSIPSLSLWTLAWIFFKLGALAFGGMWAAMDRIEKELVIQRGWITKEQQVAMMMTAAPHSCPQVPRIWWHGWIFPARLCRKLHRTDYAHSPRCECGSGGSDGLELG